jgi:hypothetical protein
MLLQVCRTSDSQTWRITMEFSRLSIVNQHQQFASARRLHAAAAILWHPDETLIVMGRSGIHEPISASNTA